MEEEIETLKATFDGFQATVVEKNAALEEARKQGGKSGKALDKALKEVASCVRVALVFPSITACLTVPGSQNDEIEKLAADRFAVYRRCKLDEIELPLEKGSLDKVPIEEVSTSRHVPCLHHLTKSLRLSHQACRWMSMATTTAPNGQLRLSIMASWLTLPTSRTTKRRFVRFWQPSR